MRNKKEMEEILPHKLPMVLIDRVVSYDLEQLELIAEVDINPEVMFFDNELNQVPTYVGMEYMAQTIGALSGVYAKLKNNPIKLGFVIGASNYECFVPGFKNGECLTIKIAQLFFNSELGAFDCAIIRDGKTLAAAQLNVYQPAALDNFL